MEYIVPPINLSGTFKLKEPLTSLINEKILYTVESIKSISSLINEEINVEKFVFLAQGLTRADYTECLKKKIPIIVIRTAGNSLYNIPANYFIKIPQVSGIMFINKAIIINLGYIPKELDLNFLLTNITDVVTNSTGIVTNSKLEDISSDFIESFDTYETYEADRLARITNNLTCPYLLAKANSTISDYKVKVKALMLKLNI